MTNTPGSATSSQQTRRTSAERPHVATRGPAVIDTLRMKRWEIACDARSLFGESPNWDSRAGSLIWLDMLGESIHVLDFETGAHRSWASGPVMSVLPRSAGGFAVVTPAGLALLDRDRLARREPPQRSDLAH
jgi:sugar lactone lactonase YvrE